MKLSTKTRYGLRALVIIALEEQEGPVSIQRIAEKEGISIKYLVQLLSKIRKAGVIKSVRGSKGGFLLNRPAKEITITDVFKAVGEIMTIAHCYDYEKHSADCDRVENCYLYPFWQKVTKQFVDECNNTSLYDLIQNKNLNKGVNYE